MTVLLSSAKGNIHIFIDPIVSHVVAVNIWLFLKVILWTLSLA